MRSFALSCDDRQTGLVQTALLVACCCACGWIRFVVQSEAISDLAEFALQVSVLLALLAVLFTTARAVSRARSRTSRLTLATVPLAVALLGGAFVKASYADVSCELQAMLDAREANVAQTSIVVGPTGNDVRLSGEIREGAARRLEALLEENPGIRRIHLTSEGGLAEEGQAIGDVIAAHGMVTYVPDYCVSACTLSFVRGRERLVQKGARVGFHAPYVEGLFGQVFQDDASAERLAYIAAGVTPSFTQKALGIASADMWFPDADRLIADHVATGVVDRYRFPASYLDGAATIAGTRKQILQTFPMLQALADDAPGAFGEIASAFLDDYRRGLSEGAAVDAFKARIAGTLGDRMAAADDRTVLDTARFLARAMAVAPVQDCVAIARRRDLMRASEILSRSDHHAEGEAAAIVERIVRMAGARDGSVRAVSDATVDGAKSCSQWREVYARVLGLPEAGRAGEIRAMMAMSPVPTPRTAPGTRVD